MTPLESLVDDVFSAVKAGDYSRLAAFSAMLETVSAPTDPATLTRIAKRARDNAALLDATIKGLRAARRRIDALRNGQTLTTYDSAGQKHDHSAAAARTHRL
ncbi:hypothetical protein HYN69_17865 [Gemmobacter aquarius]|uniref:FlgN protein n=1 Tax=Paragemmobacter aquarius TaxID=2169400 RepID=A0A2S0UQP4_9RHOB|nr:hypothetical protein [Gemmobacter aquarius]AWB50125.1 hypothetical protein HYN69_17865 [Gemmobacter aquarius]